MLTTNGKSPKSNTGLGNIAKAKKNEWGILSRLYRFLITYDVTDPSAGFCRIKIIQRDTRYFRGLNERNDVYCGCAHSIRM